MHKKAYVKVLEETIMNGLTKKPKVIVRLYVQQIRYAQVMSLTAKGLAICSTKKILQVIKKPEVPAM
jgi:hypothetical protein